jgi:hypothetical protein
MARAMIKITIADGANRSEVGWETSNNDLSFDEFAQQFEEYFLSPEPFMSVNTASGPYQDGNKIMIRKSNVIVMSIREIKEFHQVLEGLK